MHRAGVLFAGLSLPSGLFATNSKIDNACRQGAQNQTDPDALHNLISAGRRLSTPRCAFANFFLLHRRDLKLPRVLPQLLIEVSIL